MNKYPADPVLRRRIVRLRWILIPLLIPKLIEITLKIRWGGSAIDHVDPYNLYLGGIATPVPAWAWRTVLVSEIECMICFVLFLLVGWRVVHLAPSADKRP